MPETKLLGCSEPELEEAAGILRRGGLVGIPTETVYGLAANALSPEAARRIYAAKGRPSDNPLIVHIAAPSEMRPLVRGGIPPAAQKLAEAFWPGPLTIILPKSGLVPKETSGGLDTVAIRMPAHPVARHIISLCGLPLAAPSANTSGLPSPTSARHVLEDMRGKIDAVVDGGECRVGVESTVVTLCTSTPRILRPGGITPEMIERVLGSVEVDEAVLHGLCEGRAASSPGMKYKHYSPKASVVLLDGPLQEYIDYVNQKAAPGVFALCFEGEEGRLLCPAVAYGREEDGASQAQGLFSALRRLDEMGARTVYARSPRQQGVELAVYNRLIRAAGFTVIPLAPAPPQAEERQPAQPGRATGEETAAPGTAVPEAPPVPRPCASGNGQAFILGLTGPTGAGKSLLSAYFSETYGAAVIDADQAARAVTGPGPVLRRLAEAFGEEILREDGTLNRAALGAKAFSSRESTARLNAITHPAICEKMKTELDDCLREGKAFIILDAPLLFEAGADSLCTRTLAVLAGPALRAGRVRQRDSLSEEAAALRIGAGQPDAFYLAKSDDILYNRGDILELYRQADEWLLRVKGVPPCEKR